MRKYGKNLVILQHGKVWKFFLHFQGILFKINNFASTVLTIIVPLFDLGMSLFFFSQFFGQGLKLFWNGWKKLCHFGQNVWKYRLKNTFVVNFNTTVRRMPKMFQWPKYLSQKWQICYKKKQVCPLEKLSLEKFWKRSWKSPKIYIQNYIGTPFQSKSKDCFDANNIL